jgi:O-antigen/teichoic acid export membrane protein
VSIVRQSAVILALGWVLTPVQFLTSAAVARALGPEGRGILFLLAGMTVLVTALTSMGATAAAGVLYRQRRHPPARLLGTVALLAAGSAVLVTLVYLLFSEAFVGFFMGDARTVHVERWWVALALAVVPVTVLVEVGDVLLISENQMRIYALRNTGGALLGVTFIWLFAFVARWGLTGVLLAQLLAPVFGLLVVVVWVSRRVGLRNLRGDRQALRDLMRIGLQQSGVSLVAFVAKRLDGFIIARLLTLTDAGYYAVANTIQNLFINIPRSAVWPLVFTAAGDQPERHEVVARATRLLTVVVAVSSLAFMAISPFVIVLLFGQRFAPSISPVCLALIGVMATPIGIGASALFTAQGRPGRNLVAAIPGAAIQVALNFALVPRLGASGSAIALSANYVAIALVQLVQIHRDRQVAIGAMLLPRRSDLTLLAAAVKARLQRRRAERSPS